MVWGAFIGLISRLGTKDASMSSEVVEVAVRKGVPHSCHGART